MNPLIEKEIKTALITGGASGIGLAIARKFTENGIRCILVGRDEMKLSKAATNLGKTCEFVAFDITRFSEIPGMVTDIYTRLGKIDVLVNNAGIHLKKPLFEVTDEEYQTVIRTNQVAVFSLSREVGSRMARDKKGSIINISSMASQYGLPQVIAYTAAKSAVEGMTRAMAVELSPLGIRVNCIAPGFIETEMSSNALDKDRGRKEKVLSRTPMGRLGKAEEVADAALFLATDASSYITGVVLPVDGGNAVGF
ncbi:MAG TPA: SDR family oxidoreductase [Bacteroidales bacterium]|nr:SDR family oxidoreductase [Bacteroidales bacterium]